LRRSCPPCIIARLDNETAPIRRSTEGLQMANAATHGNFVWYEHMTKDAKAAIGFYGEVVGLKTQPFGNGTDYVMWTASQGPLGGVMKLPEQAEKMGAPPHWMGNIMVKSVDETVALAKKLGGKVYKEAEEIPTVGRFAVLADPQGAAFAVFQPGNGKMDLHDQTKDGEICWNELFTDDVEAGFKFYSELFGWKVKEDMDMGPMGKYRVFALGEQMVGGMMKKPPQMQMPPSWLYYFQVADLEAATARATKQGAKVLNGPMDVPGGRITQLMDPQGAAFALHTQVKK
jgi:predicted enzyme related to lactoylglutathione lyase